jgi:predicted nucleic acid-binding Zn ribbon protein
LTQCPKCGADSFRKQVTAAGFQLKGSGWYVTDFRGGSPSKAPTASDTDGKSATSAEAGKTDGATSDSAKPDSSKSDSSKSDAGAPASGSASSSAAAAPSASAAAPASSGGASGT